MFWRHTVLSVFLALNDKRGGGRNQNFTDNKHLSRHYRQATQGVGQQSPWVGTTWSFLTHRDRLQAQGFPVLLFADCDVCLCTELCA